jgi:outer membrane protein assembly factor BamE (lipoprotein component of BamABCDE complex)
MRPRFILHFGSALTTILLSACQTGHPARAPREAMKRQLSAPSYPQHDFRKLRGQLKGRTMRGVIALLGKPASIFSSGSTESWDYVNAVYDPVSNRVVKSLRIWFKNGVFDYLSASY